MAFTAAEIKNLALMELNHETITDWTDQTNTDIPIIDTQYALAKKVALTMYQWSWAFKYAILPTYEYVVTFPADRKPNSVFTIYTDNTKTTQITEYVNDENKLYVNAETIYLEYVDTADIIQETALTGINEAETVGNYKRATLLPTDFLGYLAAYPAEQLNVLADYTNIGTVIYTNNESLRIKYIADVDEAVFTPEFVDWFKVFIAQRLNGYLNGDMQRQQLLTGEEPFFFRKAKNIDSKRNKHDSLDGNPMLWIRGKIGGSI